MRTYILTDKEREMVEAYLGDQDLTELEMSRIYTIRTRAKKSVEQLGLEVDLLNLLLEKSRRPKCFGTEKVLMLEGVYNAVCLMCSVEDDCLIEAKDKQ